MTRHDLCSWRMFVPDSFRPAADSSWRAAWIVFLSIGVGMAGRANEKESKMNQSVLAVRAAIVQRFMSEDRGLILTRVGRGDPLEDTSLYGGFYLGALSLAYECDPDPETARLARRVYEGLRLNASVAAPGFISRGVESDRKTFRGEPSVDQYTGVLYGLWEYWRSSAPDEGQRQEIAAWFADVLGRLRRDEYRIRSADRSHVTQFGQLADVRPTRAERLLSFLLTGSVITGDSTWRDEYLKMLPPRLEALHGFNRFASWVLIQTGASLRMLCTEEADQAAREVYVRAGREVAERCIPQIPPYREFFSSQRSVEDRGGDERFVLETVRIPVEAITTVLLVGGDDQARQVQPPLQEILLHLPFSALADSRPLVSLEWAYWLSRRRGFIGGP